MPSFNKTAFLRALEEDREFRYAVMGLLGFRELLERFTRLEERQQRLEEKFAQLEERFAKLEERQQRLEERFARLEEEFKKLEERFAKLEERFAKLEERVAKLEERQQRLEEEFKKLYERQLKLEERFATIEEEMRETRRVVLTIAHRFGVLSEAGFREAMKYVVEEALGAGIVERWVYEDEEGVVYGYPSIIEVDVVIKDSKHILVEVKSRVSKGDVAELYRKGILYRKVRGIEPDLVIIGGFIDPEAYESAGRLGVKIRPIFRERP